MSFAALLPDTCEIFRPAGTGDWGERNGFTSLGTFQCRFNPSNGRVVRSQDSERETVDGTMFLQSSVNLDKKDEVVIDSLRYRIVNNQTLKGFSNKHHQEVMLKQK